MPKMPLRRMPLLQDTEREGEYTYYQCTDCLCVGWYHESDTKTCRQCGSTRLTKAPKAENKAESDRRSRELGLW